MATVIKNNHLLKIQKLPSYMWGLYDDCIKGERESMITATQNMIYLSKSRSKYLTNKILPQMDTDKQLNIILLLIDKNNEEEEILNEYLNSIL